MKNISIIAICLTLASCAATKPITSDPIDDLVTQYNASYGLWINGTYPIIDLPSKAKPKEVLAEAVPNDGR